MALHAISSLSRNTTNLLYSAYHSKGSIQNKWGIPVYALEVQPVAVPCRAPVNGQMYMTFLAMSLMISLGNKGGSSISTSLLDSLSTCRSGEELSEDVARSLKTPEKPTFCVQSSFAPLLCTSLKLLNLRERKRRETSP